MRRMQRWIWMGGLVVGMTVSVVAEPHSILLVIADDVGVDSLAQWNNDTDAHFATTPTIDALAERGIIFSQAYANPTCSPTRAAILTGRNGWRTGVYSPKSNELPANEPTLPRMFAEQQLGYELAQFGKWHLGEEVLSPNEVGGWPHFAGSLGGGLNNYRRWTKVVDGSAYNLTQTYATAETITDTLDWIDAQGTNNWFAWVAFNAAHTPLHKPPPAMYTTDLTGLDTTNAPRPFFEAMVEAMDYQMGRLIGEIDTNTTTIIFLGDNGTDASVIQPPYDINGRAKGSLYEGGTHVPMIVAGPAVVNGGRTNDAVVHCADLYNTILELAGGVPPESGGDDSRSLMPILEEQSFAPTNTYILMESDSLLGDSTTGRAIRDEAYKLIQIVGRQEQLYDLRVDPLESTNLLDTALSSEAQATYDSFSMLLTSWTNPVVPVRVDADNVNGPWDGWTWSSAFASVQDGIDAAALERAGEVWVAEGIYKPTAGTNRFSCFELAEEIPLYGGFSGVETNRAQRNPAAHATVLSGDLGVAGEASDNCYHVVVGANGASLDGFTIQDGCADGAQHEMQGGGLFCVDDVSLTLVDCLFTNNVAQEGGGVYAYNASSSDFTNCRFVGNQAKRGGALLLRNGCSGTFEACTFLENEADWAGGGIYADYGSSPTFLNCTFSTNSTLGKGGAFFTDDLASQVGISSPVFSGCRFEGNRAAYRGGAIYNFDGSETSVSSSSFVGNQAGTGGGAMANDLDSTLTLDLVTFSGNLAAEGEDDVDSDSSSEVN